jgi:hypothetical protein
MSIESSNSVKRFSGLPSSAYRGNKFRIQRVSVAEQPLPLFNELWMAVGSNEAVRWRNVKDKAV